MIHLLMFDSEAGDGAMEYRETRQLGFGDELVNQREGLNDQLRKISHAIDWAPVVALLRRALRRKDRRGAPGYPPEVLLRCLVLQSLYGLSDPETEAAVSDRLSFREFVGLSLQAEVPDHSTIWRFREVLVELDLARSLFQEVNRQLEAQGLMIKSGTLIDATLIEAQAARPKEGKVSEVDRDARFAKKQSKSWFGYKGHVGVDEVSNLIRAEEFTAANVNDTEKADDLIMGDEEAVYADQAYDTKARRARLKKAGIKPRIMRRPNKHHKQLSPGKLRFNKAVSRVRAGVERVFGDIKRLRGWSHVRSYTLGRNAVRFTLLCTVLNLKRATVLAG